MRVVRLANGDKRISDDRCSRVVYSHRLQHLGVADQLILRFFFVGSATFFIFESKTITRHASEIQLCGWYRWFTFSDLRRSCRWQPDRPRRSSREHAETDRSWLDREFYKDRSDRDRTESILTVWWNLVRRVVHHFENSEQEDSLVRRFSCVCIDRNPSDGDSRVCSAENRVLTVLCFNMRWTTGVNISMTICDRGLSRQCWMNERRNSGARVSKNDRGSCGSLLDWKNHRFRVMDSFSPAEVLRRRSHSRGQNAADWTLAAKREEIDCWLTRIQPSELTCWRISEMISRGKWWISTSSIGVVIAKSIMFCERSSYSCREWETKASPTVISFNKTSGRLADRKIRSNFNLFL